MRFSFSILAVLAAGALGVAAQTDILGNIPQACSSQCGFTKDIEADCADVASALGTRSLVKNDVASCLNKICSQSLFNQMQSCIDCLESNGAIDKASAESVLSTVRDTCNQLNTSGGPIAGGDASNSTSSTGAGASASATMTTAASSISAQVSSAMSHASSPSASGASDASSAAAAATSSSAAGTAAAIHLAAIAQVGVAAVGVIAGALLL